MARKKTQEQTPTYTARTADKHELYQMAVQSPEAEVAFVDRVYSKIYGKPPTHFREDFSGTCLISCHWVRKRPDNHAYCVDLDKPTLAWGVKHNVSQLKPDQAARLHQINDNVLHVTKPKVQVVGAYNFSYFIFKTFPLLTNYFTRVHKSLRKDGLFILDAYGGYEAQERLEEETELDGFTYVWDQDVYNPIDDHTMTYIHFKFPDGSRMRRAFSYDWRLWTLGGIRDALAAAGFSESEVYWEGTDKHGEGNGVYRACKKADNCPGWNAYIVARP